MGLINRFKTVNNYYRRKITTGEYPIIMNIEIINTCNFRCIMCPIWKMKRPIGKMSFELWKKIIDEISGKVEMIMPHIFGESLLHPEIVKFVKYAKEAGVNVSIDTNASVLSKKKAEDLFKAGLDKITICFDGHTKKIYEKVRVGGVFEETKRNLENAIKIRNKLKYKTKIYIQFISLSINSHEIPNFIKEWEPKVDKVRIKKFGNLGANISQKQYTHKKFENSSIPCNLLWNTMAVSWEGNALMCCQDLNGLRITGNLENSSVKEIWNGKRMQNLRRVHRNGKRETLCKNCSHKTNKFFFASAIFSISNLEKIGRMI